LSAAEIVAIRHLLGTRQVHGANLTRGVGIYFTRGAIKKILRGKSAKKGLVAYAQPLLTRYADCTFEVSKDQDWLSDDKEAEELDGVKDGLGMAVAETSTFGDVYITGHALERYWEYLEKRDGQELPASATWKSLCRRLDSGLEAIELPADVMLHKRRKYGDCPTEVCKHPTDPLQYTFSLSNGRRTLVTVYVPLDSYRDR
jgi:hypothetical protein